MVGSLRSLKSYSMGEMHNLLMISVGSQGAGPNAKSDALGTKVFPVAGLAVDLPLPLAELAAVHPLVADVTGEAGLVPGFPRSSHQLRNEDWLTAPRADLGTSPLRLDFQS